MEEFEQTSAAFVTVLEQSGVEWKELGRETMGLEDRAEKVLSWISEFED
jgi:hypothetical protein